MATTDNKAKISSIKVRNSFGDDVAQTAVLAPFWDDIEIDNPGTSDGTFTYKRTLKDALVGKYEDVKIGSSINDIAKVKTGYHAVDLNTTSLMDQIKSHSTDIAQHLYGIYEKNGVYDTSTNPSFQNEEEAEEWLKENCEYLTENQIEKFSKLYNTSSVFQIIYSVLYDLLMQVYGIKDSSGTIVGTYLNIENIKSLGYSETEAKNIYNQVVNSSVTAVQVAYDEWLKALETEVWKDHTDKTTAIISKTEINELFI